MRKRITVALAAVLFIVALTVASLAQSLSLYGGVYRAGNGGDDPIAGAKIYLRRESGERIGPAITDSYGRYAFYDIGPDRYRLMVYVEDALKWQDDVMVPGKVKPIVLR